jgi:hypothetical protein
MRLPKVAWRGELKVKSVFVGRKNLLLKESAMVSSALGIATNMELDA